MASELLLDTGALVTLLDRSQTHHQTFRAFFDNWQEPLLAKYSDLPMDFADATLVALADELGTDTVFTTDRRDFGIYRLLGDRPFRILPDPV